MEKRKSLTDERTHAQKRKVDVDFIEVTISTVDSGHHFKPVEEQGSLTEYSRKKIWRLHTYKMLP